MKQYNIYGDNYTAEELRAGYRAITGLDNDNEFTDDDIYNYLIEALGE